MSLFCTYRVAKAKGPGFQRVWAQAHPLGGLGRRPVSAAHAVELELELELKFEIKYQTLPLDFTNLNLNLNVDLVIYDDACFTLRLLENFLFDLVNREALITQLDKTPDIVTL